MPDKLLPGGTGRIGTTTANTGGKIHFNKPDGNTTQNTGGGKSFSLPGPKVKVTTGRGNNVRAIGKVAAGRPDTAKGKNVR